MQTADIEQHIQAGLPGAKAYVEGDGTHFQALVVSDAFIGQSRIKRQQLVYDTVKTELLNGALHALSIKTMTNAEWQTIEDNAKTEVT